jgi:hypothetical protein
MRMTHPGYCRPMTESNMHSTAGATDGPAGDSEEVIGAGAGNTTEKDPALWTTGDEPMTGAQRSYLDTLAREAGETLPADLTKAEASEHIERLQAQTGRGASTS